MNVNISDGCVVSSSHDWDHVYSCINTKKLKKNKLLTTIPELGKEWEVSMQIKLTKYYTSSFHNIFHMTIGGGAHYGERTPGIWIDDSKQLYISSAVNGDNGYHYKADSIPLNKYRIVKVQQTLTDGGKYMFAIFIDRKKVFNVVNTQPEAFKDVKVFASNEGDVSQAGSIKEIIIKTQK